MKNYAEFEHYSMKYEDPNPRTILSSSVCIIPANLDLVNERNCFSYAQNCIYVVVTHVFRIVWSPASTI